MGNSPQDSKKSARKGHRRLVNHFQPFPNSKHVALQLDAGEIVEFIRLAYDELSSLNRSLDACSSFEFLDNAHLNRLADAENSLESTFFWLQMNQLLILVIRSTADAACGLFDGLSWSLGTMNELSLALIVRALIEHASVVESLRKLVAPELPRLRDSVWPAYDHRESPSVTETDRKIHAELLRVALGRRNESIDQDLPSPGLPSEWSKFNSLVDQKSRAIPSQYQPKRVGDYIKDATQSEPGYQHFGAIYGRLCEFCHPNAASRCVDFLVRETKTGKHEVVDTSKIDFGAGLRELARYARLTIPGVCKMLVDGLTAFQACRMPMAPLENGVAGAKVSILRHSPEGTYYRDEHGRTLCVPTTQIRADLDESMMVELTPDEERRIRDVYRRIEGFQLGTIELCLKIFCREGPYLEEEIRWTEHAADVFEAEKTALGEMSAKERHFILFVIHWSREIASLAEFRAHRQMKGMPNLERIYHRMRREV